MASHQEVEELLKKLICFLFLAYRSRDLSTYPDGPGGGGYSL